MNETGLVGVAQIITSTVNNSTSAPYKGDRGLTSWQATVKAVGTGTSVFSGICTINASNDNDVYLPIGTLTALGTLAAAGTSSGTASSLLGEPITAYAYGYHKVTMVTTATGAGLTLNSVVNRGH